MRDDSTPYAVPEQIRADPAAIAHGASRLLDVWRELTASTRRPLSSLDVDAYAFGSLPGAVRLWRAHAETLTECRSTIERIAQVLEGDVDRLYGVAYALAAADQSASHRVAADRAGR